MLLFLTAQAFCTIFSYSDFHLSKYRQKTACSYSNVLIKESQENNIDPKLMASLIYVESGWKKTAVSSADACGLTQVIPKYTGSGATDGVKYTCEQLKEPRISIVAGTKILRWWINYHKDKLTEAQKLKMGPDRIRRYSITRGLCGYNAGFRCSGKKPSRGGMRYAKKVLDTRGKVIQYFD